MSQTEKDAKDAQGIAKAKSTSNGPKKYELKEAFRQSKLIKIRFAKVGRFYPITREALTKLMEEGKLSNKQVNAFFKEVK